MRFIALAFAIAFLAISATAQTAKSLTAKYGAPHDSYEIRPWIFMTARFAPDGRICEASVEKRHVKSSGAILLDETFLSQDEMTPIVQELVPINERGEERKPSGDISIIGGGMTTTYDYENARITYYRAVARDDGTKNAIVVRGIAAIVIQWKSRGCN